jgi:tryptophanyl-tRNA synthetase
MVSKEENVVQGLYGIYIKANKVYRIYQWQSLCRMLLLMLRFKRLVFQLISAALSSFQEHRSGWRQEALKCALHTDIIANLASFA